MTDGGYCETGDRARFSRELRRSFSRVFDPFCGTGAILDDVVYATISRTRRANS